ncbi:sulfurtransferase [Thalassoroseus pseudoceratinae]|uniref:sulfurtransferase n=1 Tax=Thalassoroseus pseudoceratinae TaxID=2713176 RepID=UPI001F0E9151|nr:sulfurtransferase [Thalassoroseus pseudoceratinae]
MSSSSLQNLNRSMAEVVNIAAYKFADLTELAELRSELRALCQAQRLKGTILLSPEGINLFVAGDQSGIDALLGRIREIPGLTDLEVKESLSDEQPFQRMLVKIKREIISFGVEGIEPHRYTSPRISAAELKQWLDEGRPVTLLDTRNNFEIDAGTFENAVAIDIENFRQFPEAVEKLPAEMKQRPVVTFCTGGIRCEKAAPYLERVGFENVLQLDGGILKYLEVCGGDHYDGDCFVFDRRVAVNEKLAESPLAQCFVCQAILTPEDQQSPLYVEGQSCPHCHRSVDEQRRDLIASRQRKLADITQPLPGSQPYTNHRPLRVASQFDGLKVLDFLDAMKTQLSRQEWSEVCENGHLLCNDAPVHPGRTVRSGEILVHVIPMTVEPEINADIEILYEDDAIVVVNKPAPLPVHPCGRFNRNSLTYLLNLVYAPLKLRPAHRLDAETTGVMVFSKTRQVARQLQPQFDEGKVQKRYLARVQEQPEATQFDCQVPISAEPGPEGVRVPDENGLPAETRFETLQRLDDGTAILQATPMTGRTNQIRLHLWHLGFPIVGDPIYRPNQQLAAAMTTDLAKSQLGLHAAELSFVHPTTELNMSFQATEPDWFHSPGEVVQSG